MLHAESPALHLLQHIRDEAHRLPLLPIASVGVKNVQNPFWMSIPGIGPTKRRELITYFGGSKKSNVPACRIAKSPGISTFLARITL